MHRRVLTCTDTLFIRGCLAHPSVLTHCRGATGVIDNVVHARNKHCPKQRKHILLFVERKQGNCGGKAKHKTEY
ncbi:hypothetical protein POVWA2_019760 [Plasmodium ovale wallikeri]|uniref:Uncharacterized protein n=1 Tax=Plasmodium ovale wallikeri TaxID=864142 RepID=A0A1A8YSB2_PLAOA|nr:hypothetical protein POVWA2_019760 [Plasmodium ovale wallikeri]